MASIFPSPRMCLFWLGPNPALMLYSPELMEKIVTKREHLNKGFAYDLLHPWLGLSLLTTYVLSIKYLMQITNVQQFKVFLNSQCSHDFSNRRESMRNEECIYMLNSTEWQISSLSLIHDILWCAFPSWNQLTCKWREICLILTWEHDDLL